jgi:competence CoiA-like predicted nuclease
MTEAHQRSPTGSRVHISHATKADTYFCGQCGDEVRPIQGQVMPWHYRHKKNDACPYLAAHQGDGWGPP